MNFPKKQTTKTIKQELHRMIQGALFGQSDEDDDYREPNDSESTNDNSNASFDPVESVDEDVTNATDETGTTAEATEQIEAVETIAEVAVAAATETVESMENEASDSNDANDSVDAELLQATSAPFVGAWQALVSQTNWEKGKIILAWRAALVAADAPVNEYSDEAWATLVEHSVTGQHVGRLRRVYQQFGAVQNDYANLSWTHFQIAMDWSDAEMWLEGAVQEKWSVSSMCENRWEATGAAASDKPQESDIIYAELDEDAVAPFQPIAEQNSSTYAPGDSTIRGSYDQASGTQGYEGPDFGDASYQRSSAVVPAANTPSDSLDGAPRVVTDEAVQPFKDLADLPDDLQDPLDNLKVAILQHKANHWESVNEETVVGHLNGLIQMIQSNGE
ncbi:MAG TPA: hypothetical protein EYM79_07100 [Planctomycetes bacterium]|nr:hypothetical protein [Planctomycetota bacterium]